MKEPKYKPHKENPLHPFTVPQGYFEVLKKEVMQKIEQTEQAPRPEEMHRTTWEILRPYLYLAAMFVGMLLMFKAFKLIAPQNNANTLVASNTIKYGPSAERLTVSENDLELFLTDYEATSNVSAYLFADDNQ